VAAAAVVALAATAEGQALQRPFAPLRGAFIITALAVMNELRARIIKLF
jgi:hypothetical protein